MKIEIRKARVGDERGIADIQKEGIERGKFIYLNTNQPYSKEQIKNLAKELKSDSKNNLVFIAILDRKIVGSLRFSNRENSRKSHIVDMGWLVHPDYQGRGIGTRLLDAAIKYAKSRKFKKIEIEVAEENIASIKLAKKFKFLKEGTRKKALRLDDGKYIDMYIFGRLL